MSFQMKTIVEFFVTSIILVSNVNFIFWKYYYSGKRIFFDNKNISNTPFKAFKVSWSSDFSLKRSSDQKWTYLACRRVIE